MKTNRRLLFVDDEQGVRDAYRNLFSVSTLRDTLEKGGQLFDELPKRPDSLLAIEYDLVFARNGEDAVETVRTAIVQNEPFAVAFIDMQMPGINGAETSRQIWAIDQRIKIVIVTAFSEFSPDDIIHIAKRDDMFYLNKPFKSNEIRQFARTLTSQWAFERECERELRSAHEDLKKAYLDTIHRLVFAAEYKDANTHTHIVRMSRYSAIIARGIGLSQYQVDNILHAAPMHDIGKIGIPDHILIKPGKLTAEEFEIMKTHTTIGSNILAHAEAQILITAQQIAISHHEKWNGLGFPKGLAGENIPLAGRIIGVADVFDALTSERPYKQPYPIDITIDIMKKMRGIDFDPEILDIFLDSMDEIEAIRTAEFGEKYDTTGLPFTWSERDRMM